MKKSIITIPLLMLLMLCTHLAMAQQPQPPATVFQGPPRPEGFQQGPPLPPYEEGNRTMPYVPAIPSDPMGPPPEGDLSAREVLEQVLLAKVAKQLKLNDEQTVILVRKFNEQKEVLLQKTQQRNNLATEIRRLIHDKTKANPKELEEKFSQLLKMDMELAELKQKWVDNLSMDLPLDSKIQLYLLFSDFENEIRKFLRKAYDWKQNRFNEEKGRPLPLEQRRGKPPKPIDNPPDIIGE